MSNFIKFDLPVKYNEKTGKLDIIKKENGSIKQNGTISPAEELKKEILERENNLLKRLVKYMTDHKEAFGVEPEEINLLDDDYKIASKIWIDTGSYTPDEKDKRPTICGMRLNNKGLLYGDHGKTQDGNRLG